MRVKDLIAKLSLADGDAEVLVMEANEGNLYRPSGDVQTWSSDDFDYAGLDPRLAGSAVIELLEEHVPQVSESVQVETWGVLKDGKLIWEAKVEDGEVIEMKEKDE